MTDTVIGKQLEGGGEVVRFGAAPGAPFNDEQAQEIGRCIEEAGEGGEVTTEAVLAAAQKPGSPLNALLEWDDKKAAHSYRMTQARDVVNHLQLVVKQPDGTECRQKYAISLILRRHAGCDTVQEPRRVQMNIRSYVPTPTLVTVPAQSRQAEAQAMQELRGWYRRYEPLKFPGLTSVMEAVAEVLGK